MLIECDESVDLRHSVAFWTVKKALVWTALLRDTYGRLFHALFHFMISVWVDILCYWQRHYWKLAKKPMSCMLGRIDVLVLARSYSIEERIDHG